MTRLSTLILLSIFVAFSTASKKKDDGYDYEIDDVTSQDPYFEKLMRENCPIKKKDGSVCATKEYEDALRSNGLLKLRESEEKHHLHHHHRHQHHDGHANNEVHLARKFCCIHKECLLDCHDSVFLAGYPENEILLESLDVDYYEDMLKKNLKDKMLSMEVLLMKKTHHFEKIFNETYYFLSAEQQRLAIGDFKNITGTQLATGFPSNFGLLWNLDPTVFETMDEYEKKELLCKNGRNFEEIDFIRWRLVIGVLDMHFKDLIHNMKDFSKLAQPKTEC